MKLIYCIGIYLLSYSALYSNTIDAVQIEYKGKLEQSLNELKLQREQIAQAQIPLAKESNELKASLKKLREELNTLKSVEDSKAIELSTLKNNILESEKEINYISQTLIDEAIIHLESTLSIGKLNSDANPLKDFSQKRDALNSDDLEYLETQLQALSKTYEHTQSLLNVQTYSGEALSQDGKLQSGQYIQLGPISYFITDDKTQAGLIIESQSLKPEIFEIPEASKQVLLDFGNNTAKSLPIDPSLNRAILIASTEDSFEEHLRKGGIWVYPIIFFAALSSLIALIKFLQLGFIRLPRMDSVTKIAHAIRDKDFEQASSLAKQQPQPSQKMLLSAVEYGNENVELIEEAMMESILQTQPKLERFLNILAVTAATAPLLGLLGTVTGIIKTFKLMEVFGAGDPKPLISGISEALITTELGLILAIPALILHALLSRRVLRTISKLEECSHHLINLISRNHLSKATD